MNRSKWKKSLVWLQNYTQLLSNQPVMPPGHKCLWKILTPVHVCKDAKIKYIINIINATNV